MRAADERGMVVLVVLMMPRKDQLLRAVYYEVARNEARVTNYHAAKVYEGWGKK